MEIQLPTKKGNPNTAPIINFEQLVVVGANGSGKTRFGSDIEKRYSTKTHRISAQKSLSMPFEVSPKSKTKAEMEFQFGYQYDNMETTVRQKFSNRWGNKPSTFLLDDYEKLMVLLHTEEYEESLKFKQGQIERPITKLDRVESIWQTVLPHRKLIKKAGIIETYPTGKPQNNYNATEMSDGERVIFYLVGEVVCAQENSIIIIDEPEMHIHKSLIKTLFDLIEIERPDCCFVYLTHDIDFAFSRQTATKIWTKSYEEDNSWDYEFLDEAMPIPEQLYLEVLGSRKPVIFIEGDNSSIDYEIYEQVYFDFTLKPLGGCEKVIQSVKSFNEQNDFHHIESFGIIDRDRRQDADIVKLNSKKIWVLDVAEAENLLLIEPIVRELASYLGKDSEEIFNLVKQNLIMFFESQLNSQILIHFKEILRRELLQLTNFEEKNINSVLTEIDSTYSSINKQDLYNSIKQEFENVVSKKDYNSVLRLFNLKNALIPNSKVCELIGVKNKEDYKNLVITLLKKKGTESQRIITGINDKIIKNVT
jgi:ABC-type lipoprotein export system ATPase subunit